MNSLEEVDSVEILVIVDNEVDPMSTYPHPDLKVVGNIVDIAQRVPLDDPDRGDAQSELKMSNVCCGAHGLSLMIVGHHPRLTRVCGS